ncbi:translation initiation factor IF-2-like [Trachypithecus francoisi]|uniref:translation initiation factor IF-2-like n=1 Tax=Trachypithecus francoisi TaxID=54180 RepID=UPI00141AFCD5|nr:translation initiation factor IF-2-like [Trachypithecus francoisi]
MAGSPARLPFLLVLPLRPLAGLGAVGVPELTVPRLGLAAPPGAEPGQARSGTVGTAAAAGSALVPRRLRTRWIPSGRRSLTSGRAPRPSLLQAGPGQGRRAKPMGGRGADNTPSTALRRRASLAGRARAGGARGTWRARGRGAGAPQTKSAMGALVRREGTRRAAGLGRGPPRSARGGAGPDRAGNRTLGSESGAAAETQRPRLCRPDTAVITAVESLDPPRLAGWDAASCETPRAGIAPGEPLPVPPARPLGGGLRGFWPPGRTRRVLRVGRTQALPAGPEAGIWAESREP